MEPRAAKTRKRDRLDQVVGEQVYSVWIDMLRRLVPEGRTHRLAPTIAAMLQYAAVLAFEKYGSDPDKATVAHILVSSDETGYDEAQEALLPVVRRLFKDAGVKYERTSASGGKYSVAEEAVREYINWFNMPWED